MPDPFVTLEMIRNMSMAEYAAHRQRLFDGTLRIQPDAPPDVVRCMGCHLETADFVASEWPGYYRCIFCADLWALTSYVEKQRTNGERALWGLVIFLVVLAFVLCL